MLKSVTMRPFSGYEADGVNGVRLGPHVDDELRPRPVAPAARRAHQCQGGGHLENNFGITLN